MPLASARTYPDPTSERPHSALPCRYLGRGASLERTGVVWRPTLFGNRVVMEMVRQDDTWLVSGITAL